MELCRKILLALENDESAYSVSETDQAVIRYHLRLMNEAGLIKQEPGPGRLMLPAVLTWPGHDFLDAARNEAIWEKAKDKVKDAGGAWTFDVLKALLVKLVSDALL